MLIRLALAIKDHNLQSHLERRLSAPDVRVETFSGQRTVWQKVLRCGCDVIVLSEALILGPADIGIGILKELPEKPSTIVILDSDSAEAHAQLTASGANAVLYAGILPKSMYEAIETALSSHRQYIQNRRFDRRVGAEPKIADFDSDSHLMRTFMEEVMQVIPSDSPILLLGETGVGKEHLAKAIHAHSPRSAGPFVSVNMAALPDQLLESELFGHEQGAFTGAIRYRRGAFELAHGGTIFLDEIGEMPLQLQTKLLRVLQDYAIKPVGGETAIELDVRVIAATNQNLEEKITKGNFRRDLYYRLSVLMLTIPPLRQRREDIPAMVRRFIAFYRYKIGKEIKGISAQAQQAMCQYDWPGNIRELMNVIERAILLCKSNEISILELPDIFKGRIQSASDAISDLELDVQQWQHMTWPEVQHTVITQVERYYLAMLLKKNQGRVGRTAQMAGIHPRGLYNKMRALGLHKEDFKHQRQ